MNSFAWRCPVCSENLVLTERSFSCVNRHGFDKAKEGYVNLLLPNKKKSADPGDSKAMLKSRRVFLERGFYAPLVEALAKQIRRTFPDKKAPLTILDTGCGEGYYLGQLAEHLGGGVNLLGVDISRAAMQMTGKRYPKVQGAVASSYAIPVPDNSVDILIRVFAPVLDDEIARVLKPGGLYLWVYPGEQHLFGLRELIYNAPQPHGEHKAVTAGLGLLVDRIDEVAYPVHLPDAQAVAGLLEMTPYYWSASKEKQDYCQSLESLDLGVDFRMVVAAKEGVHVPSKLSKASIAEVIPEPKSLVQVKSPGQSESKLADTGVGPDEVEVAQNKPSVPDPWRKAMQKVGK